MSYIDAECPECSEQFEVYDDDCDECSILEQQIADLEMTQLSEEQEKKLEEYDRLKTWLINIIGPCCDLRPSDFILGLDRAVANILADYHFQTDGDMPREYNDLAEKQREEALLKL